MKLNATDLDNIEVFAKKWLSASSPIPWLVHPNDLALMIAEIRRLWAEKRSDEQAYRGLQKLYDDLLVTVVEMVDEQEKKLVDERLFEI